MPNVTMLDMSRILPSAEVDAQLMHHLETSYASPMRIQRFRTQPVLLERPPNTTYSGTVTLTCATCGDSTEYQVLSLLAAWLRWGLWVVLTVGGLTATVWGIVLMVRTEATSGTGMNFFLLGLFSMSVFGMYWVTEFGVGGTGTRFTIDPHGLRRRNG